jgi:cardiolipin synthase
MIGVSRVRTPTRKSEDRVLTAPNLITAVRLAFLPLFAWLLLADENRGGAAVVLGVLGCTDWVDGYVARRFGQISNIGKVLDPVADRVVLIVGVAAILIDGSAPLWLGIAALVREALISAGTLMVAALGGTRVDVQWVGKAGTFALYVSFPIDRKSDV